VLRAPLPICLERVAEREGPELSDPAVIEQLWTEFADLGEQEPHALEVEGQTPEEVAEALAHRLADGFVDL
jgi:hypothetical protein